MNIYKINIKMPDHFRTQKVMITNAMITLQRAMILSNIRVKNLKQKKQLLEALNTIKAFKI